MTPEQQTPASVDLMIVRRIAEGLRRKAVEYRKGDKPQRAEGCDEDADALERVASRLERLSAEREVLAKALDRQADNMAFLLNHAPIVQRWYDKFTAELAEDRAALTQGQSRQTGWQDIATAPKDGT